MLPETTAPGGAVVVSPIHSASNMLLAFGKNSGLIAPERANSSHRQKNTVMLMTVTSQGLDRLQTSASVHPVCWMRSPSLLVPTATTLVSPVALIVALRAHSGRPRPSPATRCARAARRIPAATSGPARTAAAAD